MAVSLKSLIPHVFPFGNCDICHYVLGHISLNDGAIQNDIVNHLATADKRTVGRALDFLVSNGFLVYVQSKSPRRNVRNAFGKGISIKPKQYHLTFKGFLASLAVANLGDSHLMQKYLRLFSPSLKNKILEYVRNEIFLYLSYTVALGLILTKVNDLVFHIDDTGYRWDDVGLGSRASYFIDLTKRQADFFDSAQLDDDDTLLVDDWNRAMNLLSKNISKKEIITQLHNSLPLHIFDLNKFVESMKDNNDHH